MHSQALLALLALNAASFGDPLVSLTSAAFKQPLEGCFLLFSGGLADFFPTFPGLIEKMGLVLLQVLYALDDDQRCNALVLFILCLQNGFLFMRLHGQGYFLGCLLGILHTAAEGPFRLWHVLELGL